METPKKTLEHVLAEFDAKSEPIVERDISWAVKTLRDEGDTSKPSLEWLAEVMAFDFREDCNWSDRPDGGWGTYFGPMTTWESEDGTWSSRPSLDCITPEMLDYWKKRAIVSSNLLMKARYAGLVWEFSKKVRGAARPVEMAWMWIDSTIQMTKNAVHKYPSAVLKKLKQAISLAITLNDDHRIEAVRDAIMSYEDDVAQDDKIGLCVNSFDLLVGNKKIPVEQDQLEKIIRNLEESLSCVAEIGEGASPDPWAAEAAATRLARYYKGKGQAADVKRVMLMYGKAFEKMAEPVAAMLGQAWLEKVYQHYREFGLKVEAEELLNKIRELGPDAKEDMKRFSTEFTVTDEDMRKYIRPFLDGDISRALNLVAATHIPRRDQTERQLLDLSKSAPMQFLLAHKLQDHEGRTMATVGPLKEDLKGHIIRQTAQNMQFTSVFLREVFREVFEKFKPTGDQILDYLFVSPLFKREKRSILKAGISAFLAEDAMGCIHYLIPQLESALRVLVEVKGGTVLKKNRIGGFNMKVFDELLRDQGVRVVLGEDVPLYFLVLFSDPRGVNLRNNVCHGISPEWVFNMTMADRVFHALLVLALVRENKEEKTQEEAT